jgi:hypothetical protein
MAFYYNEQIEHLLVIIKERYIYVVLYLFMHLVAVRQAQHFGHADDPLKFDHSVLTAR